MSQTYSPDQTAWDITGTVRISDPEAVHRDISSLLSTHYPDLQASPYLVRAFRDFADIYAGRYSGYSACDTPYHDIQHTLDMVLAFARLLAGHQMSVPAEQKIPQSLALLGLITALFHDVGYIRHQSDHKRRNGAEYAREHISRGATFLKSYLKRIGLSDPFHLASRMIHYTGYEIPLRELHLANAEHTVACMLGTADYLSQMSDRAYLEKCLELLYHEFVAGGLDSPYFSAKDMLLKTPQFFHMVMERLQVSLGDVRRYMSIYFGGTNLYELKMRNHVSYLEAILQSGGDMRKLRRTYPLRRERMAVASTLGGATFRT
ncbi:HD domain-containing protein [Denitratisoma oestradiolicum]|uniref:HD/PDEase domain-containing protein n=1 Tax=Denitratisoma oestradiolicum TaxID=311182 RepID=A0A6S6XYZ6_9PROT|nr:HD domain-containing protein [Denitratisoma oestradiolicum]TWO79867.1 hypothetical protein CBW56_12220 [Denitratisoma oestradiolicum]CAB1369617.1 conserved protein of unknown function [Denitratisoma oestradiolicum]